MRQLGPHAPGEVFTMTSMARWAGVVTLLALVAGPAAAEMPKLDLPLDCEPGKTCFVQKFVDVDPGPEFQDYLCGQASDPNHTGTDFRLLNVGAAAGVVVKAAAPGTVAKTREGVADKIVSSDAEAKAVSSYGLGNAVIIDHGDGWQTIYGHMLRGSIKVRSGDHVEAGTPLGEIGLSGLTEYAHVHFEVRHDGKVVDPYTGVTGSTACVTDAAKATAATLWASDVLAATASNETHLLEADFAGAPVTPADLEVGLTPEAAAGPTSPGLVFYARAMNMREGDQMRFVLEGPAGWGQEHAMPPLDRWKATYVGFAGKKLKTDHWPAGHYTGRVEIYRDGRVVATAKRELTMPE
jgi:Peptidase family M23